MKILKQRLSLGLSIVYLSSFLLAVTAHATLPVPDIMILSAGNYKLPWLIQAIYSRSGYFTRTGQDAAALGKLWTDKRLFFRREFPHEEKWRSLVLFIFSNEVAGREFNAYQRRRGDQWLNAVDYQNLAALWSQVPVCYIYHQGKRTILYPAANPTRWWQVKPLYVAIPAIKARPHQFDPPANAAQAAHEPSYVTNQRLNQQVRAAQKGVNTAGLDLPPDVLPSPPINHH